MEFKSFALTWNIEVMSRSFVDDGIVTLNSLDISSFRSIYIEDNGTRLIDIRLQYEITMFQCERFKGRGKLNNDLIFMISLRVPNKIQLLRCEKFRGTRTIVKYPVRMSPTVM